MSVEKLDDILEARRLFLESGVDLRVVDYMHAFNEIIERRQRQQHFSLNQAQKVLKDMMFKVFNDNIALAERVAELEKKINEQE